MKPARLFILLALLLFSALGLSACFGPLVPSDTTGGDATTSTPTGTSAAEDAVTTAPVTSAVPDTYLGVVSVRESKRNGITLVYADNTTQKLGQTSLPIREGYNSCEITDIEVNEGIVSLTLTDSSTKNTALSLLGQAGTSVTVELTGVNGKLCYRTASGASWVPLAPLTASKVDDASLFEALQAALSVGVHPESLGTGTVFAVAENNLRFRATEWTADHDLAMDALLFGSSNKNFNIQNLNLVAKSTPYADATTRSELFKSAGDDITPLNFNGTYIGANHGYFIIAATPCGAHGKTEADIGSIWIRNTQKYVLVKVDSTSLWFCPFDDNAMESGNFSAYANVNSSHFLKAGDTLTHVSGATHRQDITASGASKQEQFWTATNHLVQHAFLDGTYEVSLEENGSYECEFVDFYEAYDIIYLPDMLTYLIENAGKNTNESHHDEEIEGAYVRIHVTYRYHKNGSCVVYSQYDFDKTVKVGYFGAVQSQPFGTKDSDHYVYVPGSTDYSIPTLQGNESIYLKKDQLATAGAHITSYFQMTDAEGSKAMNLGFNPYYGYGTAEKRDDYLLGDYGFYYTSFKMYPYLISSCKISAGERVTSVAYRVPSVKIDEDLTALNWYWVGEDIYLSLHTDAALDKTVSLPDYMEGMTVSLVESSASSFTVNSETISGGISVTASDAGYAIVKLSPQD